MTIRYLLQCLIGLVLIGGVTVEGPPKCQPTTAGAEVDMMRRRQCLVEYLLDSSKYSPLVRPVKNTSDVINIEFSIQLSMIVNVDEKNQIMKTNVWLQMYWHDYQMVWDKNDFDGITVVQLQPDKAWTPDIVLFNNADGNYEVTYRSNVLADPSGQMSWIPPAIYKSSCSIDVEYFPFDEQVCDMKFGSWTFRADQLSFTFYAGVPHIDVTDYLPSGAWDIVEGNGNITSYRTGNDEDYKTMVIFKLKLRRKTLFYTVNLIIPCVLISFVTICVFFLPADAGEKITLCISILLALVVFLLLISKILPPALTIPLVARYLLFTFIMNVLAIMFTVIVINRNYRTPRTHQMPYWVRFVFLNILSRILLMKRPSHDSRWRGKSDKPSEKKKQRGRTAPMTTPVIYNHNPDLTHSASPRAQPLLPPGAEDTRRDAMHPNCRLGAPASPSPYPEQEGLGEGETTFIEPQRVPIAPEILRAAESLQFIARHLKKEDEYNTVLDDWKYVARVIDRFLLYVFLVVTLGGSIGVLTRAPYIFESINQDDILKQYIKNWDDAKAYT